MPQLKNPFKRWKSKYHPLKNTVSPYAPFNGYMFEPYGEELNLIKKMLNQGKQFWTLVQGEDDTELLIEGVHFVNRLGYFITEKRAPINKIINLTRK